MSRLRRAAWAAVLLIILGLALVPGRAEPSRELTLMVYLCGSDLESGNGSASADIAEMMAAQYDARRVTVLVMSGGTSAWSLGFDPADLSIRELRPGGMREVWRADTQSMGLSETLAALLRYGLESYPAREYALILWDHGGGPLEGVCRDELFSMDSLSLHELTGALEMADLPSPLRFIGFDACLMGSAEVAAAVAPYARYMIASQDTEPARGWNYAFLNGIEADADGAATGRRIIEGYFDGYEGSRERLTLSCIDLSQIDGVRAAVDAYYEGVAGTLDAGSFSRLSNLRRAAAGFGKAFRGVSDAGYDLVDLWDLTARYGGDTRAVRDALDRAVVLSRANVDGASGLTVYHPYANKQRYAEAWGAEYAALRFSDGYARYVSAFGALLTGDELASWDSLIAEDDGYGADNENLYSLPLTDEQSESLAGAELLILAAADTSNRFHGAAAVAREDSDLGQAVYYPVAVVPADLKPNGTLTARYAGKTLYVCDENGEPLLGPISYRLTDRPGVIDVYALYRDDSGREGAARDAWVAIRCSEGPDGALRKDYVAVWDAATGHYTSRAAVDESRYTDLCFYSTLRRLPEGQDPLPGFDSWESAGDYITGSLALPEAWSLRWFDAQLTGDQLIAVFHVTDTQQTAFCSIPARVINPNLGLVDVAPREFSTDGLTMTVWAVRDGAPLDPGLNLIFEFENTSRWTQDVTITGLTLDGARGVSNGPLVTNYLGVRGLEPGKRATAVRHVGAAALTGMDTVGALDVALSVSMPGRGAGWYETAAHFDLTGCDVSAFAPPRQTPLARCALAGADIELTALTLTPQGGLRGVLRVTGMEDQTLDLTLYPSVDGVQTGQFFYLQASACAETYHAFEISPGAVLDYPFTLAGEPVERTLADRWALYRAGQPVASIGLTAAYGFEIVGSAEMALDQPIQCPAGASERDGEGLPLLTGALSVTCDRAIVFDDGAAARLRVRNDTGRDVMLRLTDIRLDGQPIAGPDQSVAVIAGGEATAYAVFDPGRALREGPARLSLRFAADGGLSEPASLVIADDARGAALRPGVGFTTEPAAYDEDRFAVSFDDLQPTPACALSLSLRLDRSADAAALVVDASIENRAAEPIDVSLESLRLNGSRYISPRWALYGLGPGQTETSARTVPMWELTGLSALHTLELSARVRQGDQVADVPIRLDLGGYDVSALAPSEPAPLASAPAGDLSAILTGLKADGDGAIRLRVRLVNEAEGPREVSLSQVCLGPVNMDAPVTNTRFAGPGDRVLDITLPNRLTVESAYLELGGVGAARWSFVTRLMERLGQSEVADVRLFLSTDGAGAFEYRALTLTPEEPLPLGEADPLDGAALYGAPVGVTAHALLVGDDGAALALTLTNETDRHMALAVSAPEIDGRAALMSGPAVAGSILYLLPPHSVTPASAVVRFDEAVGRPETLSQVTLIFTADGERIGRAGVAARTPVPVGAEGGALRLIPLIRAVREGEDALFSVSPACAGGAHPVTLTPPPPDDPARQVTSFVAAVLMADGGPDDGYTVISYVHGNGGSAPIPYTGLALTGPDGRILLAFEYPYDDGHRVVTFDARLLTDAASPAPDQAEGADLYAGPAYVVKPEEGARPVGYIGTLLDADRALTGGENVASGQYAYLLTDAARMSPDGQFTYQTYTYDAGQPFDIALRRAEDLGGALYVLYEMTLDDGSVIHDLQPYPAE